MTAPGRLVVRPLNDADRRWLDEGRPYFLNRAAFEANRRTQMPVATTAAPAPLMNLVGLAMLFLPYYLFWRCTTWMFPWLPGLLRPISRMTRAFFRNLRFRLWSKPVREHGLGMTLWCWWCLGTLATGLAAVLQGQWKDLLALIPMVGLTIAWWRVLRWWRTRQFQPRPLPRRRQR